MSDSGHRVTLAAASMEAAYDKQANLAVYRSVVEDAAARGVDLLVLPEQSLQGYIWGISHAMTAEEYDYQHANSEPVPGPSTHLMAGLARDANMTIVFGMTERGALDLLYNSAVLVTPGGDVGVFRKVHGPGDELHVFRQGEAWPVFDTPVGRVGSLICYDALFPEAARELALGGAEVLAFPTAWPSLTPYWDQLEDGGQQPPEGDLVQDRYFGSTLMRAVENQRWVVASNQCGRDAKSGIEWCGHSRIVAPSGEVLADVGRAGEGLAVATVDVRRGIRDACNAFFDMMKDRAPHTYRLTGDTSSYLPANHFRIAPPAPGGFDAESNGKPGTPAAPPRAAAARDADD